MLTVWSDTVAAVDSDQNRSGESARSCLSQDPGLFGVILPLEILAAVSDEFTVEG